MCLIFVLKNISHQNRIFYCKVKTSAGARSASYKHVLKIDQFWKEKFDSGNVPAKYDQSPKHLPDC